MCEFTFLNGETKTAEKCRVNYKVACKFILQLWTHNFKSTEIHHTCGLLAKFAVNKKTKRLAAINEMSRIKMKLSQKIAS